MGVVEEAEEAWDGGGLGEEENRICVVSWNGGLAMMGTSDRTFSSYDWVMWVTLKALLMNGECQTHWDMQLRHTMTSPKFVESQVEFVMGR